MLYRSFLLAVTFLMAGFAASADPGYYVVTPYSQEGVRTLDLRYWTTKANGSPEVVWPEVGFGYGVTSRWTTELFVSYIGSSQMATQPSTLNWQNDFLLTQGEYPFDLALHAQLIGDLRRSEQRAIELGPVFQTDVGRTQITANLFLERQFGATKPTPTQLKYQWQLRYRWVPALHFGAQGFGELGRWDNWSDRSKQSHRAGPAVFGTLPITDKEVVKLQAAYLPGKTYTRRGHMFTLRAHYDF